MYNLVNCPANASLWSWLFQPSLAQQLVFVSSENSRGKYPLNSRDLRKSCFYQWTFSQSCFLFKSERNLTRLESAIHAARAFYLHPVVEEQMELLGAAPYDPNQGIAGG